jgi:hypothetical protein
VELKEAFEKAGLPWPFPPRSLTYDEYNLVMPIAVPHGPDEACTCDGCGACTGNIYGCTCDVDWDMAKEIRDMWYF